jgi:ABC-type transport system involved in multi-copper enzyme maturation permease subunit
MRNPARTPFGVIFQNEVLLSSKRIAPYALMIFFSSNAVLWTSAAVHYGWAINSDFYIARNYGGFAFGILGLPLFAALIMADPVIRDLRLGVAPLIFSKPVSRAQYLFGKFFGSFFVLVCCQAAFALTMLLLQVFHTSRMIVLPFRVVPYFKHFFLLVVITYLLFAAVYFTAGTLTRNAKIVYGLAVSYYPLYIAWQVIILKRLPSGWQMVLDPLLFNAGPGRAFERSADYLNYFVVSYTPGMIANRALVMLVAAVCLACLYARFTITERPRKVEKFSVLNLAAGAGGFYYDPLSTEPTIGDQFKKHNSREKVLLPAVTRTTAGVRAHLQQLFAALSVELRLLFAERSLVVIVPLAIVFSTLDVAFWSVAPDPSYSAAYAAHTAKALLLFLLGFTVFYTVEAMHRDRDLKIEPLLWSQAAPNYVLLLSKFLATLAMTVGLIVSVAVITITLQIVKHSGPVELPAYLRTYSIILIPNAIFLAAAGMALSVLLRDRYLTYAVAIGACAGLFYLYTQGHNHWLYNPLLFQLWDTAGLAGGTQHSAILWHRIYVFALAFLFLSFAHFWYPRKSVGK